MAGDRGRRKKKGESSLPTLGAYDSQGTGSGAEWSRCLRTLAKGPGPGIPPHLSCCCCCCFRRARPWEGAAGRGRGWTAAAAISPRRACSSPSPGDRGAGCSRSAQADQESPARGRGYSKCGLAHLTLTHIFRN